MIRKQFIGMSPEIMLVWNDEDQSQLHPTIASVEASIAVERREMGEDSHPREDYRIFEVVEVKA